MNAAISLAEATRAWVRVALLSFGGPAGQIAVMHRILVEEKRWISEERFLHALNFCMLLPGPEAQQLATYIGWLMHGTRGGLIAGTLFVLPGFIAIMAFSIVYVSWGTSPLVAGVFLGLKAAVVALIVEAIIRIGKRALRSSLAMSIAVLAFLAIFLFRVPFPLIVVAAGAVGYFTTRNTSTAIEELHEQAVKQKPRVLRVLAVWLSLWFAPLIAIAAIAGVDHVFSQVGVFFSKMAVVTFGGAYAVLAYVAQQAVQHYRWVTPTQMLDGLGLAETTPGPLILVVQFVAFLAAYLTPGVPYPLLAGAFAACLAVWVTFVPCFLWIFLGAPYVEALRRNSALSGALAAITAAVVGVIANLAVWFALHAIFASVQPTALFGPLSIDIPDPATVRWPLLLLIGLACLATFALEWSMARTLSLAVVLGVAWSVFS
jgi:chromate transporter